MRDINFSYSFRRTCLTQMHRSGVPLKVIQKISGLSCVTAYSPINVGEVDSLDLSFWQEAERVLQEIISEEQQQERRQSKGISLKVMAQLLTAVLK